MRVFACVRVPRERLRTALSMCLMPICACLSACSSATYAVASLRSFIHPREGVCLTSHKTLHHTHKHTHSHTPFAHSLALTGAGTDNEDALNTGVVHSHKLSHTRPLLPPFPSHRGGHRQRRWSEHQPHKPGVALAAGVGAQPPVRTRRLARGPLRQAPLQLRIPHRKGPAGT